MIVYVETNFVLEVALEQEEWESCQTLLKLGAAGTVALAVPAYALVEPIETLVRRDKSRKELAERVRSELRQLGRSEAYRRYTDSHQALVELLIRSGGEEVERYTETRLQLIEVATIIPLDRETVTRASSAQATYGLSQQDALVYASVVTHLEDSGDQTSCFITRNTRDFSEPGIRAELDSRRCKLLFSFAEGVGYVSQPNQTSVTQQNKRIGNLNPGSISTTADFDAPLPDEL